MRIVILGGDGRAHALGKRFRKEGHTVMFIPGNSACSWLGQVFDVPLNKVSEVLDKLVEDDAIDLVVGTSLDFSLAGIIDRVKKVPVYGVSAKGALLESDRGYASEVCEQAGIRTPDCFVASVDRAIEFVKGGTDPFVVKWDSLIGGTNVSVCESVEDTLHELNRRVTENVMLQEKVEGVEVSFTVSVGPGGKSVGICTVFEHKRAYDGDMGPMTAEMGSLILAGVPDAGMEMYDKLQPELERIGFTGMLDINCMMDVDTGDLWFIEFTARFGDPTTEIWVPMIDGDLGQLLYRWASGDLVEPKFRHACGIGVVVAGGGYPFKGQVKQGLPIMFKNGEVGQELADLDWVVFMSAGLGPDGKPYSKGGRQLLVRGYGDTVEEARREAYGKVSEIRLREMFYRLDIGEKWLKGEREHCVRHGIVHDGLGGFDGWHER